jgi:hypothetical protein
LGSCTAKKPGIVVAQKIKSTSCSLVLFIEQKKKRRKLPAGQGLRIFELALKPLGYDVGSIHNVIPSGLRKTFKGPLHRRLQGGTGITAPEAHEHVVGHRLCQGTALLLQAAANGLFQLGYLSPS